MKEIYIPVIRYIDKEKYINPVYIGGYTYDEQKANKECHKMTESKCSFYHIPNKYWNEYNDSFIYEDDSRIMMADVIIVREL